MERSRDEVIRDAIKAQRGKDISKGRKSIFYVLFSRMFLILALVLLQLFFLFAWFYWMSQLSANIYGGILILELILAIALANSDANPEMRIAWMIPIMIVPIFGVPFYLFVKSQVGNRLMGRKLKAEQVSSKPLLPQNNELQEHLRDENAQTAGLTDYLYTYGNFPVYEGCSYKYYACGEEFFPDLCEVLEGAKHFIFMEYFIVERGLMWDTVLEILKKKVAEGVEVRFLYDGTCSLFHLPMHYYKKMRELGIDCRVFKQVQPVFTTVQNNRDHRKILVVDGEIAFTGGINLSDEYINAKERFGYWKDTKIAVRGESVRTMLILFLQMSNMAGKESERSSYLPYLKFIKPEEEKTPGYVLPFGENPLDKEQMGERVYSHILYTAKRYVHIMTPYLLLDSDIRKALTFAAKRGVDVHIILPHIPDKWYTMAIGRTYFKELLDAGVKLSEYMPGFVHAKQFVADDEQTVVGTINLDYRSLYLHYEDAIYFYQSPVAEMIENDFQETLSLCEPITYDAYENESVWWKLFGFLFRFVAPLL